MGEVPDWYAIIQEAKYLRVAPWDLVEQPLFWRQAARESANAEGYAQEERAKHPELIGQKDTPA
jgi:hypothetical protein